MVFETAGFRVALAIASLPGMTIETLAIDTPAPSPMAHEILDGWLSF
jgi:hypothetical protein